MSEEEAKMENLTATDLIVAVTVLYGLVFVVPAILWYWLAA